MHQTVLRVLIVEDDHEDYLLARQALRAVDTLACEFEWHQDYEAGLAALRRNEHEVCLLDYRLGERDGIELLQQARKQGSRVPTLFLTGDSDPELDLAATQTGAADFLVKGELTPQLLSRSIRHAVERRRTEEQRERLLQREQEARAVAEELAEQLERQREEADTIYRIGVSLSAELDLEKLLQTVTDETTRLTGAEFGAFFYNSAGSDGEHLSLYVLSGAPREAFANFAIPRPTAIFAPTFHGEQIVRLDDVTRDPRYGQNPPYRGMPDGHLPVRSYLAVPVRSRTGEVLGGLYFGHSRPGVFSEREERMVAGLASQFSVAIDNARLYQRSQQELRERQQAEAALREQHAILRAVTEGTTDAVFVKDRDGRYLMINPAGAAFMGKEVADVIGRSDQELFTADTVHQVLESDACVLASGETLPFEETITAAGITRTYLVTKGPLRAADGAIIGLVGISRDITERKRAELALRESEGRFRFQAHLLDTVGQAVIATQLDGTITYWNRFAETLYGWAAAEAVGQNISILVPSDVGGAAAEILERVRRGEAWTGEFTVQRRDGTRFPAMVTDTGVYGEGGQLTGIIGVSVDISERKAAETALRESEARFRAIFDEAAVGISRVDMAGHWLETNRAFQRMLGYTHEELACRSFMELTNPEDVEADWYLFQQMMRGQLDHYQLEKRYRHRDGHTVWGHLTVSLLRDPEGRPQFAIGMVEDITARKDLEQQFRQAQKMEAVGRLAAGVAHDFNNMLAVVLGYTDLLINYSSLPPHVREPLQEIQRAGNRAAGLTRQLLAFSRKQVLQPKVLDLCQVVVDMEKMLRRLIGEDIDLVVECSTSCSQITADPGQIEQVLLNLAVNARDAMPRGGTLTISCGDVELDEGYVRQQPEARTGPHVVLGVSDTGIGMEPGTVARLFEPFFTTKPAGEGTGLGLATAYGIVRQSGGHVTVDSTAGKGTTFCVYLPRAAEGEAEVAAETRRPTMAPGAGTVLLVEDDGMVRGLVQNVLESSGFKVLVANRGAEALEACTHHPGSIHLLLTDVVMPGGMSGREVAERLTALRPEMKVLYMSGYTDDAVVRHGVATEGISFIQKPFLPTMLLEKINTILGNSG